MSLIPWTPIPLNEKLFLNIKEEAQTVLFSASENCFVTETGTISRFPGLKPFVTLPGDNSKVYLFDWKGDLIAATQAGNVFRINRNGAVENVTGIPLSGGGRAIFDKTEDELVIAAGGQILRFAGERTEVLSDNAPLSYFVQFIDNYLVASERDSGRFWHSKVGDYRTWEDLDVFTADAKPDDINAMIVTPYRELLVTGADSVEQFEPSQAGDAPFFRRWALGDGISAPYTAVFADNAVYAVSNRREVVRMSQQQTQPVSGDIDRVLERLDNWDDAWCGGYPDKPLNLLGQKWLLLQAPNATNPYGTKGWTLVYDYRQQKWTSLYGWDNGLNIPTRWPGWSHWPLWDRTFVGGNGVIYEFDYDGYSNAGNRSRFLLRTAHLSRLGEVEVSNLRLRVMRGIGDYDGAPVISIRAKRDGKPWTRWVRKSLGLAGNNMPFIEFGSFGWGTSWQFEIECSDDCPIEIAQFEAQLWSGGH